MSKQTKRPETASDFPTASEPATHSGAGGGSLTACDETRPSKTVSDSRTELTHLIFPKSLNSSGRLYGGELLGWLDEMAGVVSKRHAGTDVVTASIDHMDFKAGAGEGDMVYILGYITHVGNTSMEVRIDSYVEELKTGLRHLINTAYFVMVAIGDDGRPTQVPSLTISSISEQAEWEAGQKRQALRKQRRQEGF